MVGDARSPAVTWLRRLDLIRVVPAAIVLAAAGMKGHQLTMRPVLETGLFDSRWFLVALAECEFCLALWLLSAKSRKLTWTASLGCFVAFAGVSAYKGVSGELSCGCFGALQVAPWFTFVLDVTVVLALLAFRPRPAQYETWRLSPAAAVTVALLVGLPGVWLMRGPKTTELSPDDAIDANGRIAVLLPEKWLGKRFPLFDHVDVGEELGQGVWVVVLHQAGCPRCEELIHEFSQANEHNGRESVCHTAFIELPDRPGIRGDSRLDGCLSGRLDTSRDWFVTTPTALKLRDGIVEQVIQDADAESLLAMISQIRSIGMQ